MRKIVLLASYPKSGNTWIRAFLTSVWRGGDSIDINRLSIANASARAFIDPLLGLRSAELTTLETAALRPGIYDLAARRLPERQRLFLKIHDAYLAPAPAAPLPVAAENIDRVLYIVRDPRDVALSFARHLGQSVDEVISAMTNREFRLSPCSRRVGRVVPQLLSTWSGHVESWLDGVRAPLHVVRYEDLLTDPHAHFDAMVEFLELNVPRQHVARAVEAVRFDALRRQEQNRGFAENTRAGNRFFHGGMMEAWRVGLSDEQAARIVQAHSAGMRRLGYAT